MAQRKSSGKEAGDADADWSSTQAQLVEAKRDELREETRKMLASLTPREELVLKMHYGLGDGTKHDLGEIARELNVTSERVRQIESKALLKLRHPERATKLRPFPSEENEREAIPPPVEDSESPGSLVILPVITPELLAVISTHPELLRTVEPRTFERILAELLEIQGYTVELQRGTKDGGIDIFALMKEGPLGPHRYLVQAKRWTNAVGVAPVRELLFLHDHHRVSKACLVTTSRFTRGAWKLADEYQWQLELRDYDRLREWVALSLGKGEVKKFLGTTKSYVK